MSHRVVLDGLALAYDVYRTADAPPMVVLHALDETRQDWPGITDRLAEDFQVFAIDLRGHGDSDWPGSYFCRLLADDVAQLLDHLGLGTVRGRAGSPIGQRTAPRAAR